MQREISSKQILASLLWKLMERSGVQGISFIVSIVLARILTPYEYGVVAIVLIFTNLANVFIQSGFNVALIQKKNADNIDFSTVFFFSFFIAGLLYVLLYLSSPYIAAFYHQPDLAKVIRVLFLVLFSGAVNSIQVAVIFGEWRFKKLFYSGIGAVL